jgi:hypothetical protein
MNIITTTLKTHIIDHVIDAIFKNWSTNLLQDDATLVSVSFTSDSANLVFNVRKVGIKVGIKYLHNHCTVVYIRGNSCELMHTRLIKYKYTDQFDTAYVDNMLGVPVHKLRDHTTSYMNPGILYMYFKIISVIAPDDFKLKPQTVRAYLSNEENVYTMYGI